MARASGFSLHAATICEAWQRSRLERLCRYITRPPIATKRLSVDGRGRVVYRYKHPFRDGSTHVVLEPLDFIARLAALVPRPRLNLTRFHGVFAPNFKHRDRIVPQRAQRAVEGDKPVAPMSWMQRLKRVFAIDIAYRDVGKGREQDAIASRLARNAAAGLESLPVLKIRR